MTPQAHTDAQAVPRTLTDEDIDWLRRRFRKSADAEDERGAVRDGTLEGTIARLVATLDARAEQGTRTDEEWRALLAERVQVATELGRAAGRAEAASLVTAPDLGFVIDALTDEDEIAHGEAWDNDRKRGRGFCAYCEGEWPCRTQQAIDRLLVKARAAASPTAHSSPPSEHQFTLVHETEDGDLGRCSCGAQGYDFEQGRRWFEKHLAAVASSDRDASPATPDARPTGTVCVCGLAKDYHDPRYRPATMDPAHEYAPHYRAATPDASLAKSWADSLDDVAEYERSKATPDASALRTPDPIAIGALIDNVERSLRALKDHFAPELAALASGDTEPTE